MDIEWKLSQSLTSDGQGIRCVCPLPPSSASAKSEGDAYWLLTGTQSGSMVAYGVPSGELRVLSFQHDHSCTALVSNATHYVSGCKDAVIRIFAAADDTLVAELRGHDKPVTSLAVSKDGTYLVSGSWDGTAKIWNLDNRSLVATLGGHENSVCVSIVEEANETLRIATGSAGIAQNNVIQGHSIRIFDVDLTTSQTTLLQTVSNDHEGPIRGICRVKEGVVATCSNDGTCKLRASDSGQVLSTLAFLPSQQQHPPMLLSTTATDGADASLLASAEDGHVVSWSVGSDGSQLPPQVIPHPQCVWNVTALPNGDFCTCGDDGILRIFTKDSERMASDEECKAFADEVQAVKQKQSGGPSAEEIAKLPLWQDQAVHRGKSEGQVQVFNKNGIAIAAQWSDASQTWIEVGQVMGSGGGSQETGTINGVKFDHVLPIEVDQTGGGVAKLNIGYNNGENPFVAAQRFIDDHMLPQHHLSEIANYIQQRVGQQTPTLGMDSSAAAPAAVGVPMVRYEYLPSPGYKQFGLVDKTASTMLGKIKTKIAEFGKLSDAELERLGNLLSVLEAGNRYHSSKISDAELSVVSSMLNNWDIDQVFPALDVARLVALHPDATSKARTAYWSSLVAKTIGLMQAAAEKDAGPAIPMLGLRLFCNALKGGSGSCGAVVEHVDAVLMVASKYTGSGNKNVRLSLATLLYNLAHCVKLNPTTVVSERFIPVVTAVLSSKAYEAEAVFRALVSLGTLAIASPSAKDAAKTAFLSSKVEMAASPHTEEARAVAKEVYTALQ